VTAEAVRDMAVKIGFGQIAALAETSGVVRTTGGVAIRVEESLHQVDVGMGH